MVSDDTDRLDKGGTGEGWVTLRAASTQAGVSVSSLRKWYGRGKIESIVRPGQTGPQRLVNLEEVLAYARRYPDLDEAPRVQLVDRPTLPEGCLPVPAEEWRTLMSRFADMAGVVHGAGERAGRAEAEAAALRERLAEVRAEAEAARQRAEEEAARARRRWWQHA